jgi:hypothetical protein
MHLQAGAKHHDIARSHPDPAADRRNSAADGQQNQDRIGGHRDEADPRQVLFAGP